MGISKIDHYSVRQNSISGLAKAFGHPARISIIEHLVNVNVCQFSDFVIVVQLSNSTIYQHLRELVKADIVKVNIENNCISYHLNQRIFSKLSNYFSNSLVKMTFMKK